MKPIVIIISTIQFTDNRTSGFFNYFAENHLIRMCRAKEPGLHPQEQVTLRI